MPTTTTLLSTWGLDEAIARERECWHARWLVSQGWSAAKLARAFGRDAHTIGAWLEAFRQHGPAGPEQFQHVDLTWASL